MFEYHPQPEVLKQYAALLDRLTVDERRSLEARVPQIGTGFDRGFLAALCFAQEVVRSADGEAQGIGRLEKVAAIAAARVLKQDEEHLRRLVEKAKREDTPEYQEQVEREWEECVRDGRFFLMKDTIAEIEELERQRNPGPKPLVPQFGIEFDRGLLHGLRFAMDVACKANGGAQRIRGPLEEVAAFVKARVLQHDEEELRQVVADIKIEFTPERLRQMEEELDECRRAGKLIPMQVVLAELDARAPR